MKNNANEKVIAENLFWRFADRWGSQLISLLIGIIIARRLEPEDYGLVSLTNVFISITSVFTDCGLCDSLIQKKDADELDYSTAFIANIILCLIVYFVIFFSAPYVAKFYKNTDLILLTRVLAIRIIISGFKNIHHAYVAKNMLFKKYFFASLFGTVGSGIIGITMAYMGFGVWSLIFSTLFDVFVDTVFCWLSVKWRPKFIFSFSRLKSLLNFGTKILFIALIDKIYNELYKLITGKYYSSEDLAFFDKGDNLSNKLTENIDYTVSSVLFPAMSNVQNDVNKVKEMSSRILSINTYIIFPILIGLFVVSKSAIAFIFTDKWLPAVKYVQVFCLAKMFLPFITINTNIVKSIGRSDLYAKQQTSIKIVNTIILIITARYSVLFMTFGILFSTIISVFICSYHSKELIDYSIVDQLKDVLQNLIISLLMGIIVFCVGLININSTFLLFIQIIVGIILYVLLSICTKNNSFYYALDLIKDFKNK